MSIFDTFGKTSVMQGLSYQNNYDQDVQNAIRMNQIQQEQQLKAEQKAKYYAEKLKEGTASDELGSKRLEAYYDNLNKELGTFISSAPKHWEQNLLYQKQFNSISDKYLNNPILAESQRVKMEMEKMNADENRTPDWTEQNMKEYELYKNQEFDPENPEAELTHKFSYGMRPTVKLDQAVANVSKNMGLIKKSFIGDKWVWEKQEANEEQISSAVSQLLNIPEYKYSLDVSWKNYERARDEGSQLDIYKNRLEYATALVQNTVPLQNIMKDMNPAYEYDLKAAYNNSTKGNTENSSLVPSKTWNLYQELLEKGSVNGTENLLAFADVEKNGIISWDRNDPDRKIVAYVNGLGDISKIRLSGNKFEKQNKDGTSAGEGALESINYMKVENAQRIFIDPSTNRPMIEATVSMPVTNEDAVRMKRYNFREVAPESSVFGMQAGDDVNFTFDANKKMMIGTVYLPADLTNMNNAWEYMDWGIDQKGRAEFMRTNHVKTITDIAKKDFYGYNFNKEGNLVAPEGENNTQYKTESGEWNEETQDDLDYFKTMQ